MLVKIRDEGSALVSVLVIMLVLTIGGLALAAIVTSTASGLAGSRDTAQSRAAADAGLATGLAEARRTGQACGMDISSTTAPKFRVTSICGSGRVTFTVTGTGENGGQTKTEAVFAYSSSTAGTGADMIFFGDTTFTKEVIAHPLDDSLLSIVIPSGDFTCMSTIPANLVLAGDLNTKGSCDVKGSVVAGGEADMAVGTDRVVGTLTLAGPASNTIRGTVGAAINARGGIGFGWEGRTIGGNVTSGGNVALGSTKISGSLTVPSDKTVTMDSGSVSGGIARPTTVTPPTAPTFAKWFDYKYKLSDWQPYEGGTFTPRTLTAAGTGNDSCANFNNHPAAGWPSLGAHTTPTILDARACPSLSSNSGTKPVVELKSDLVLLAKSYDLTTLTFTAAPGLTKAPRVWFIVEDTVDDDAVTCAGGAGNIKINGTVMTTAITAMAYTPCTIDIAGMGTDTWKGSFYGGKFNYGGGIQFYGSPIALPGMPSSPSSTVPTTPSGGVVGTLISQRDIP
jgi:Tfp pilus assembly protein PilV